MFWLVTIGILQEQIAQLNNHMIKWFAYLQTVIKVFPKLDHSGNVARILLGLKFVFLNTWL